MRDVPDNIRVPILLIAIVVCGAVLSLARDIAAPMTLAVVTGVIFAPIMDLFKKLGIKEGYGAFLILLATVLALVALIFALEPIFRRIMEAVPSIKLELRGLIFDMQQTFRNIEDMNEEMTEALGAASDVAKDSSSDGEDSPAAKLPSATDAVFLAPLILGKALIFAGTFYFFLVTRLEVYGSLAKRIGSAGETTSIRRRFHTAEYLVSRYFVTITIINFALGFALMAYLTAIGLPLPIVWGLAAALLNFVLYVGPGVMMLGLLLSGLINYDGFMVVAPLVGYLTLNMAEAQFVTPSLVSKHVSLNPLLVFAVLVFGLWFWGPIGGIVAIPVLVIVLALANETRPAPVQATPSATQAE
ncbi:AI-2E family transporter [Litorisediminicola beolgyonensis]|uniref:AI-2E family transporter n=1 Tax=Litorisediminicola beolgyonensis TaxID=1173614 RepID=A0ABW3ZE23_9RHOB